MAPGSSGNPQIAADPGNPEKLRAHWSEAIAGILCFLLVGGVGTAILGLEQSRLDARRQVETITFGSLLQTRLSRDLGSVVFLTEGLKSYLEVRAGRLDRSETEAILAKVYAQSHFIRNFGIAVGDQLMYVYPRKGNERVLGLHYRDVPAQWPEVQRVIDGGVPVLLGPVALLQGGRGLIFRVPIFLSGRYWGLISAVIDADAFFSASFGSPSLENFELAIRGLRPGGEPGGVVWGDAFLFGEGDTDLVDVDVPGGKWRVAVRSRHLATERRELLPLLFLGWVLAAFLGWGAGVFLAQRARLARLAMIDSLTGLPNRNRIEDRIERAISRGRRTPGMVSALLFVDLDGFKEINDRYGHRAGDAVLQAVAARTLQAVRDIDSVGRWGGDEFVILLENVGRQQIPEVCERVRQAVEAPVEYGANALRVGSSLGWATIPDDGETAVDLLRLADSRMYEDKRAQRPTVTGAPGSGDKPGMEAPGLAPAVRGQGARGWDARGEADSAAATADAASV